MERRLTPSRALLAGTLAVGVLDITDALVFFGLRGVSPTRLLQGIASGLIGRTAALEGGLWTAALGLALHFFIAFMVVLVYLVASRRLPGLSRRPFLFGPLYGLGVYGVMTYVVLPLSAGRFAPRDWPQVVNQLLIHALGVGLPAALAAWAARSPLPATAVRAAQGEAGLTSS
jgi:hypothetical protein